MHSRDNIEDMVTGAAEDAIRKKMASVSWLSWDFFRVYFKVDNLYVLHKLKIILFPYLHKNWKRNDSPPTDDVNAPDLYIPLMSFITYSILMAYIQGTFGSFNPDVLGITMTQAIVTMMLEVGIMLLGLYLLNVSNVPSLLDCLAYSSYKLVSVNILLSMRLIGIQGILFGAVSMFIGLSYGIFYARTLQRVFGQNKRNYFLVAFGLFQLPLIFYLCHF
jgi:protein transport protein YIF1